MKGQQKQTNIVLAIKQFRNINLLSKGCYKLKVEAFSFKEYMTLGYQYSQDLQEEKHQYKNNFSTKVEFDSDEEKTKPSNSPKKNILVEQFKNKSFTLPFFVKYHCQRIQLKSLLFFTQLNNEQFVQIRLTLYRKASKNLQFAHFEPVQSVQFNINCQNHFLQQRQILMPQPQCFSIKMVILSCPVTSYQFISQKSLQNLKSLKIKKVEENKQAILSEIRKIVKKQRYEAFVLRKQLNTILKNSIYESIRLPSHFLQKQNLSVTEVLTNQMLFFKYLAFYEKYQVSSVMLKQEMEHINFDKITTLKSFIDNFQKDNLFLLPLEEQQKQLRKKKLKHYIVQNSQKQSVQKILTNYSQIQLKQKKLKLKQLQKCIYNDNSCRQNVIQETFIVQKQNKKHKKNASFTFKYPIIFRDIMNFKTVNSKIDSNISNLVQKKSRKKKKYFIFAHGFQGLPIDLFYLINMIRFTDDKIKILLLRSYKSHMGQSIETMALKVSGQIKNFLSNINLKQIQPEITFIGHSMGPIILRAALKDLNSFSDYFQCFVSICSPHLGYIQGTKFLTDTGLSILSKLKPIESLSQLSNRDNVDLQKTFIYKLSKQGSLCNFKKLIFIASMDDNYVPWHSARVQPFCFEGSKQKIQKQMIRNILGIDNYNCRIQRIQRLQIKFPNEKQKPLDSFIGRTCHIKPLNDRGFLQMLTRQILTD